MRDAEESQSQPPRRLPGSLAELLHSWRYFFWALGVVLTIALLYMEENWRGHWAWSKYQRQMAAQGEPLESSLMVPPPVSPEKNFAETPFLAPLFEFFPGTQKWRDTNAMSRASGFAPKYDAAAAAFSPPKTAPSNSWVAAHTDLPAWYAAFLISTNKGSHRESTVVSTNFTEAQAAAGVLAGLAEAEPVFEELRAASRLPRSRFNIRYQESDPAGILLPHLAVLKHLSKVLQLRTSAELTLGQTNEAFSDLQLMLYLCDAAREEPVLISQLVRMAQLQIALQPLAEGLDRWSEPQLLALQERLLRFDFCADIRRTLAAERSFFGGGLIDYVRRSTEKFQLLSGVSGDRGGGSALAAALMTVAPDGWFSLEQRNYCRLFQEHILPAIDVANQRISPAASLSADARISAFTSSSPPILFFRHRYFSGLLLPALSRAVQKAAFAQTAANTAALACALECYRRTRAQFPDSLAALTPELMDKLPHDIVTGQPLKYRRTQGNQYLLYSVGWNEVDDGGAIGTAAEVGTASEVKGGTKIAEGDWVWRTP